MLGLGWIVAEAPATHASFGEARSPGEGASSTETLAIGGTHMLEQARPRVSTMRDRRTRGVATSIALLTAAVVVSACGSATLTGGGATPDTSTLNLGYLVNFTHAPALIGVSQGFLDRKSTRLN